MRKLTLIAIVIIASCTVAVAQPRAIGGRLAYGIGPSYQHSIGEKNMIQADLDLAGFFGIQGTVTYNWLFPINSWSGPGSWNWYAGVGGGAGWMFGWWGWGGYGFVGVAGMIGAEYNFKFPMQLSLDWRPVIGPAFVYGAGVAFNSWGLYASAVALGVRYKF